MGPKPTMPRSGDLYRSRLDQILDPRHGLFRLAGLIDWERFDQEFGRFYRSLGRPAKPTRLMVGLSYLKHTFNLSDEATVARWRENPYWQWFLWLRVLPARAAMRSEFAHPLAQAARAGRPGEAAGRHHPGRARHGRGAALQFG